MYIHICVYVCMRAHRQTNWLDGWRDSYVDRGQHSRMGNSRRATSLQRSFSLGLESSAICPAKAHGTKWFRTASYSQRGRSLSWHRLGFNGFESDLWSVAWCVRLTSRQAIHRNAEAGLSSAQAHSSGCHSMRRRASIEACSSCADIGSYKRCRSMCCCWAGRAWQVIQTSLYWCG